MNRHHRRAQASVNKRNERRTEKVRTLAAAKRGNELLPLAVDFDESQPGETRVRLLLGDKVVDGTEEVLQGRMTNEEKQDFCKAMAAFIAENGGRLTLDDGSTIVARAAEAMASTEAVGQQTTP